MMPCAANPDSSPSFRGWGLAWRQQLAETDTSAAAIASEQCRVHAVLMEVFIVVAALLRFNNSDDAPLQSFGLRISRLGDQYRNDVLQQHRRLHVVHSKAFLGYGNCVTIQFLRALQLSLHLE